MPTVFRAGALRFVIYPNDHRPAHVHVLGPDAEATFELNCPDGPPVLRENYRFARRVLEGIHELLALRLLVLCRKWELIHGDSD